MEITEIQITIPVFNEELQLPGSLALLIGFLQKHCPWPYGIVIANNASTDGTLRVARELCCRHPSVRLLHLPEKGRGRAVRQAWSESRAHILTYMDVDLSTDLTAFPPMIEALQSEQYDLVAGSRLLNPALTRRGFRREVLSRGYNFLVKALFRTRFSDAQCGFKAITKKAAAELLPLVEDNGWFMDTELLVLAEKLGYRIFDLPVRWVDDPDSRVVIWRTVLDDLRGLMRVRKGLAFKRHNHAMRRTGRHP
jgi:glycosyltransferase involved in cell wall biosynthesis